MKYPGIIEKTFSFNDLWKVPDVPGIYSWHLLLNERGDELEYHKVFKEKLFFTRLRGNLNEIYEGKAQSKTYQFDEKINDINLLLIACELLCPPLYIGISKRLNFRLQTHKKMLENIIYSDRDDSEINDTNIESDTEKESRYFGVRIGTIVKRTEHIRLTSFFVKTIQLNLEYSTEELRKIEKFLNRTFIPLYGRK